MFSSRKQLQRARMGRRKANISDADISDTARVLSYNLTQRDSDGERHRSLKNEGDSIVRLFLDEFIVRFTFWFEMSLLEFLKPCSADLAEYIFVIPLLTLDYNTHVCGIGQGKRREQCNYRGCGGIYSISSNSGINSKSNGDSDFKPESKH